MEALARNGLKFAIFRKSLLQDFKTFSDHFGKLCIKGLTRFMQVFPICLPLANPTSKIQKCGFLMMPGVLKKDH